MALGFWSTLASISGDGTALTAAARASLLQGAGGKQGLYTLAPNQLRVGDVLHLKASGRISCAVTTPGTAAFDLSAGVGGTKMFDSLAINLNIIAKTNVPWVLDVEGIVRVIGGNVAQIFWQGTWVSEAYIAAKVANVDSVGICTVPINTAPVLGTAFDATLAQIIDFNFTQTVATGSITLHNYALSLKTSSGF